MSIKVAPAPWQLTGQGYLMVVHLPQDFLDNQSFIEPHLQASRKGHLAYVAFAHYQQSDVGPYHELLYVGGQLKIGQKHHYSISKIYVSTQDSIDNGQINWGIPKEKAYFAVDYGQDKQDHIKVTTETGEVIANLHVSHHLLPFPVNTRLAPKALRTLAQEWQGQRFYFPLEAQGHMKPALIKESFFDQRYFPDLNQGRVLACFKVTDFSLVFPVPKTQAI